MSDKPKQLWTQGPLELAIWDERKDHVEMFRAHLAHWSGPVWSVWVPNHPLTIGTHPRPEHAVTTCITGNGPTSEANATLYAAAPALAEALAELVDAPGLVWQTPEEKAAKERAYAVLESIGWKWGIR